MTQTSTCIDLSTIAAERHWRLGRDPADAAERPGRRLASDPWYHVIKCQRGELYPFSAAEIVAEATSNPTFNRLAGLPGVRVHQNADQGGAVRFPIAMLDQVAEIMRPRRKRQVSDDERARLAEQSRRHGFGSAKHITQTPV